MKIHPSRPHHDHALLIAEALVAGRRAGRSLEATLADCPFNQAIASEQHGAWHRGFLVGRTIDQPPLSEQVDLAHRRGT